MEKRQASRKAGDEEEVCVVAGGGSKVRPRRSRPASARGFFAHAVPLEMSARARSAHKLKRSDALPVHVVRSIMSPRTQVANGSASAMLSMAALRFAAQAPATVPARADAIPSHDRIHPAAASITLDVKRNHPYFLTNDPELPGRQDRAFCE